VNVTYSYLSDWLLAVVPASPPHRSFAGMFQRSDAEAFGSVSATRAPGRRARRSSLATVAASVAFVQTAPGADAREGGTYGQGGSGGNNAHGVGALGGVSAVMRAGSRRGDIGQTAQYIHYGPKEAALNKLTLVFHNGRLETAYRGYMAKKTLSRTRGAAAAFAVAVALFALVEGTLGWTAGSSTAMAVARAVTFGVAFLFYAGVRAGWGTSALEASIASVWLLIGGLLVLTGGLGCVGGLDQFAPFSWWSVSYDMVYCAVVVLSGLRFPIAALVAAAQPLLTCANLAAMPVGRGAWDVLLLLVGTIVGSLLVTWRREQLERKEFVAYINVTADKGRREKLINEMLPPQIIALLMHDDRDSEGPLNHRAAVARLAGGRRRSAAMRRLFGSGEVGRRSSRTGIVSRNLSAQSMGAEGQEGGSSSGAALQASGNSLLSLRSDYSLGGGGGDAGAPQPPEDHRTLRASGSARTLAATAS
jgi:hypothetical protein